MPEMDGKAFSELKAREEAKRDRAYDPALRWKHIQEMITWIELTSRSTCGATGHGGTTNLNQKYIHERKNFDFYCQYLCGDSSDRNCSGYWFRFRFGFCVSRP
jgi:hypothetical protein